MLETLLSAITTFTVVIGALVACRSINSWRSEMIGKRRAEVAEEALSLAYEADKILEGARHPLTFAGEGKTRAKDEHESDSTAKYKDMLYVPVERISKSAEFWAKFDAQKFRVRALFGARADSPLIEIAEARNRVMISSRMLIMIHERRDESREHNRIQRERWEADIGWVVEDEDPIKLKVNNAITELEKLCRPAIDGYYAPERDWLGRLLGQ